MFDFDLQIFAEDTEQPVDVGEESTLAADAPTDSNEDTAPDGAETEPIPEELGGLPEEAAREVMAESAKREQEAEEPPKTTEEDDDAGIIKNQAIPYPRWAQKVAETTALKDELEAYKKRYGSLNAPVQSEPQQPPLTQPMQQTAQQPAMPQFNLTPEAMQKIEEMKKQEALRMSGLTQEDIDGMDYMEENDPRRARYKFALDMANNTIMTRIQQEQVKQFQQAEAFMREHEATVRDYNEFAQREIAEPDYKNVVDHATQEYFFKRSPAEQRAIADAYARIERKVASPAEIMLIKNYFMEAKNDYRSHYAKGNSNTNPMRRVSEAKSFPRAQQVQGTSDNDTGVSVATLERMLAEKPWDEIPEKYKRQLMGE